MPRSPDQTDAFVGARLARRRQALGLTQGALGQMLGISAQQVQKYEAGANRISASRLSRIAAALGDHPGTFFPEPSVGGDMGAGQGAAAMSSARLLTATAEGQSVARHFPLIADRSVRQAVARVVEALTRSA